MVVVLQESKISKCVQLKFNTAGFNAHILHVKGRLVAKNVTEIGLASIIKNLAK